MRKFPVQPNQVDVGQLMIYGAMLAMRSELSIALKLIYVEADTFEEKVFLMNSTIQVKTDTGVYAALFRLA